VGTRSGRTVLVLAVLAGAVLALAVLRLAAGPRGFGLPADEIAWGLRGTRVIGGLLLGAALGVSGVLMQCLLRNPLASPDLMGVSNGAGFAVMLGLVAAERFGAGVGVQGATPTAISACLGALGALGLVWFLARKGLGGLAGSGVVTLALVGVAVSFALASATMLVQHLLTDRGLSASRWLLGFLSEDLSTTTLAGIAAVVLGGVGVAWRMGRAMDALSMGEEHAWGVGVPVARVRLALFLLSGVLAAAGVLLAGPVGFVGLIAPHLVRLAMGPRHGPLVVGSALCGGAMVVASDTLIRVLPLGTGRLPLGVVTSLIGAPILIWMLRKGMRH